jgi:hypothetical protein
MVIFERFPFGYACRQNGIVAQLSPKRRQRATLENRMGRDGCAAPAKEKLTPR